MSFAHKVDPEEPPKAYILYENEDWLPPLERALNDLSIPFERISLVSAHFDLSSTPPHGVYINRISPSSHTREHFASVSYGQELLYWLESHGRVIINGVHSFRLEVSKIAQYAALARCGIRTPRTVAVIGGPNELIKAAADFPTPFITKHNCGGKGLGVHLFRDHANFNAHVRSPEFEDSPDNITLIQAYIESPEQFISRAEIVDGEFLYAIKSDTSGGFELCPAQACIIEDSCPIGKSAKNKFQLHDGIDKDHELVLKLISFCKQNKLDVAGIEFVQDAKGTLYTYDINGTTNYNPGVELEHGLSGMHAVAMLVRRRLDELSHPSPAH